MLFQCVLEEVFALVKRHVVFGALVLLVEVGLGGSKILVFDCDLLIIDIGVFGAVRNFVEGVGYTFLLALHELVVVVHLVAGPVLYLVVKHVIRAAVFWFIVQFAFLI